MSSEIDLFPRGATATTKSITKTDKSRVKSVDRNDLFLTTSSSSSKRKRSTHDTKKVQEDQKKKKKKAIEGEDLQGNLYRRLHKQNLTDGVLLCGCIEKISPYELRVSLPHQNIGYVPINMISDEYTEMLQNKINSISNDQNDDLESFFRLGQFVLCRVIESAAIMDSEKTKEQKRLHLSINPKDVCDQITPDQLMKGMILPGVVSSITDHGFLIDVGFSQRKGFLKKNKQLNIESLKVGTHGLFQVKESSSTENSRIIALKMIDQAKKQSALSPTKLPFHMLVPGQKCKVTVTKTRVNGLEVTFGDVKGFIHLQDFATLTTSIEDFAAEQELEAIALSIDPTTKLVHFSMQKHLFTLDSTPTILQSNSSTTPMIGSIETCIVLRAIGSSLAIRLPTLSQHGIIASTHLTDEKSDDLQQLLSSFKAGSKHQCRIIGLSLSNNLAICSLKKSIIEAPFVTYSDIEIGSLVKGTVNHVDQHGLIINLTKYITGFVPIIHNADIPIKEALNKFPLKKKVQCRVLQVDPSRQRLILSMKKSLINSKLPIISSYDALKNNIITIGVIISIQEYGLLVKLFGDLCGLVPKGEIGQLQGFTGINVKSQLQQMFYVGQTVSCKVMNFNEDEKKITLSLKVPGKMTFGSKLAAVPDDFSIGKVVQWVVNECDNEEHLIGNVLNERKKKILPVTLTRNHVSDFIEHQTLLMRLDLSADKVRERDGIFWSHLSYINISIRKIFLEFSRRSTLPQKFNDCTIGSIVPGVVQNIFDYGLFIDLPNTIVAFAPQKHLNLTGTLETIEKKYRIGQTVFVRILQLDETKQRCIVSLKSLLYDGEIAELSQPEFVLRQYLDEKYQIIETMKHHGTGPLSKFFQETKKWIGFKCRFLIEKRQDDWFVGRLENGLPACLPYNVHHSIGDSIDGQIIDFHLPAQQFVLTVDLKKPIRFTVTENSSFSQCKILCQLPTYALAITSDCQHLIHLPTFSDLNSFYSNASPYQREQEIPLTSTTFVQSEKYQYIVVPLPNKTSSIRVLQANDSVVVTIVDVLPKQLNVKLNDGTRGRIHITELFDDPKPEDFRPLAEVFHQNESFNARILGTRNIEQNSKRQRPVYELSLREKTSRELNVGDRLVGFVDKIDEKSKGFWFYLSLHVRGYAPPELLLTKTLKTGQCCSLTITNKLINDKGEHLTVSMFDGKSTDSNFVFAKFHSIVSPNEFHFLIRKDQDEFQGILMSPDVSDVFEDFVIWKSLINVKPPMLINGQMNLKKELWKFKNKTIRAFVKSENLEKKQIFLSTRKSRLEKNYLDVIDDEIERIEQIAVGDVLRGYIDRLTNRQISLMLTSDRSIVGQIEKVVNRTLNGHLREYLDVGMIVEATVLSVDAEKKKCSMKLTDQFIEQLVSTRSKRARLSRASSVNGSVIGQNDQNDDHESNDEPNSKRLKTDETVGLGSDVKFDWNADLSDLRPTTTTTIDVDVENEEETFSSLSNRISTTFNSNQRTHEQFEDLVKKAPNDSQLWIDYIQFYIDQAETDRARAIAERALINIFYREERDKLNVWIAYLALENRYGTPEKLNTILSRALGNCEGVQVYKRLAIDVYEKNEQFENANATFALMVKKFNKDKQAWLEYIMYLFRRHQTDLAKTILDKSFASLSSTDHVEMINKFGQLEFKYGDAERAKTLYEKLLSSYPKRTDLWSIYIDMLIKYDKEPINAARSIFERVLSLNIPPKKMKFLIKKYLQFENQHGTTEDLKRAKERITHYVNDNELKDPQSNIEDDEFDF